MGEPVGEYAMRERERASGAPSGVAGDSLLPSENHEAIPCIERAPRDVDDGDESGGRGRHRRAILVGRA